MIYALKEVRELDSFLEEVRGKGYTLDIVDTAINNSEYVNIRHIFNIPDGPAVSIGCRRNKDEKKHYVYNIGLYGSREEKDSVRNKLSDLIENHHMKNHGR